jgi:hypothetical protein
MFVAEFSKYVGTCVETKLYDETGLKRFTITYTRHMAYLLRGGIAPLILNIGNTWK